MTEPLKAEAPPPAAAATPAGGNGDQVPNGKSPGTDKPGAADGAAEDDKGGPKTPRPTWIVVAVMAIVAVIGVMVILAAWKLPPFDSPVVTSDDAYVMGRVTVMATQVDGYVHQVLVRDYQFVSRGQALIKVDDRIYRQQVDQTQGQLGLAVANYDNSVQTIAADRANLASRRADLLSTRAEQVRAALDDRRLEDLASRGSVSRRERDQGVSSLRTAQANVAKALAAIRVAEEQIKTDIVSREGLRAQVASAQAQVELARINLSNTVIYAPRAGQISDLSAREGQYLAAGSQIVYFVPPEVWVIANYKETKTHYMQAGQPVTFTVDALGDALLSGHLETFAPATASQFSVLKPDNATGNFTKIVQRIPIRIRIDPGQRLIPRLRPGLSVVVKVDTVSGRHPERCFADDPDRPGRSRDIGKRNAAEPCDRHQPLRAL